MSVEIQNTEDVVTTVDAKSSFWRLLPLAILLGVVAVFFIVIFGSVAEYQIAGDAAVERSRAATELFLQNNPQ